MSESNPLDVKDSYFLPSSVIIGTSDMTLITDMSETLSKNGIIVSFSGTGNECLQKIMAGEKADLFLLDIDHAGMPPHNFLKAYNRIKTRLQKSLPPVVAVCQYESIDIALQCKSLGVVDIYVCPFESSHFLGRIKIAFNTKPINEMKIPESAAPTPEPDEVKDTKKEENIKLQAEENKQILKENEDLKKKLDTLLWKYLRPFKFSQIPAISKIKETDDQLGNYELQNEIGHGAFGVVRLGINTDTNQKVAIKRLSKEKLHDVEEIESIEAEIKLMTMLTHNNIVRLLGVEHTNSYIYIILEYLGGGNLRQYLCKSGDLREDQIKRYFFQICSAVEYCHSRQIAHRDLKLENIMLDEHNQAKLTDFGLSVKITPGQLIKQYCGSPGYMAPEVLAGETYDPLAADVYSLGVILMDLAIGPSNDMRLAEGKDDKAVEERLRVLSQSLSRQQLQRFSTSFMDLLTRMLCYDRKQRILTAHILKHPFFGGLALTTPNTTPSLSRRIAQNLKPPREPTKSVRSSDGRKSAGIPRSPGMRRRSIGREENDLVLTSSSSSIQLPSLGIAQSQSSKVGSSMKR